MCDHSESLHVLERRSIAAAGPARRAAFSSGRHAARLALGRLGVTKGAIARAPSGAPRFPAGFVGSISHSRDLAIAAVERLGPDVRALARTRALVPGIGIDIEQTARVGTDVLRHIATGSERDWIGMQVEHAAMPAILFACKEAIYKCIGTESGTRLAFGDVALARFDVAPVGDSASASIAVPAEPVIEAVSSRFESSAGAHRPSLRVWLFREHVVALAHR